MPTIRSLLDEAKAALVAGKAEAALTPCQAILTKYPKHVEATCLLAEACRELRQLPEALDLFERVVSADPESLIGHWGLSTILEEQGQPEAALYELRIAWDLSPGHPAVREELLRLGGAEPRLSRAGLARVYWRGHQHRRALFEARAVLAAQPERLDVGVLLAETLWRLGRRDEAAEVSADLLAESPDCLKANLIRGYATPDGRKQLARALQLDPESRVAVTLYPNHDLPSPLVAADVDLADDPITLAPISVEPPPAPTPRVSVLAAAELPPVPAPAVEPEPSGEPEPLVAAAIHRPEPLVAVATDWPEPVAIPAAAEATAAAPPADAVITEPAVAALPRPTDDLPRAELVPESVDLASTEPLLSADAVAPAEPTPGSPRGLPVEEATPSPAGEAVAAGPAAGQGAGGEGAPAAIETPDEPTQPPVPEWLAAPPPAEATVAAAGLDPNLYAEWADLLSEEVDLDPAAAARLEAALAEATGTGGAAGPWKEIVLDGVSLAPPDAEPEPALPAAAPAAEEPPTPEEEMAALRERAPDLDSLAESFRDLLRARPDVAAVAAVELRGLIEASPDHAGLRRALGDAYMRCGRFQKAIEEYNRAVALQPPAAVA